MRLESVLQLNLSLMTGDATIRLAIGAEYPVSIIRRLSAV